MLIEHPYVPGSSKDSRKNMLWSTLPYITLYSVECSGQSLCSWPPSYGVMSGGELGNVSNKAARKENKDTGKQKSINKIFLHHGYLLLLAESPAFGLVSYLSLHLPYTSRKKIIF